MKRPNRNAPRTRRGSSRCRHNIPFCGVAVIPLCGVARTANDHVLVKHAWGLTRGDALQTTEIKRGWSQARRVSEAERQES